MQRPVEIMVTGQSVRLVAPAPSAPSGGLAVLEQLPLPLLGTQPPPQPAGCEPADDPHAQRVNALAGQVSRRLLEVLQNRRGNQQLATWMAEDAHLVLGAWQRQRDWSATTIHCVRASRTTPRSVEASMHLMDGQGDTRRNFSAVMCLEHGSGRWCVTSFGVLLPPAALASG